MWVDVGGRLERSSLVTDLFTIKTRILKFLPIPIPDSITSATKHSQRQNNESALDSQQMLNLQEINCHFCTESLQEFKHLECSEKESLATMFPVTIGRTFDTLETDQKNYKCCDITFMLLSSTD